MKNFLLGSLTTIVLSCFVFGTIKGIYYDHGFNDGASWRWN